MGRKPTHGRTQSRKIMLKLKSFTVKQEIMKKRRQLITDRRNNEPAIFLNEDLLPEKEHILYELRQLKREKKIKSVWMYKGKIYAKQEDGEQNKVINCKTDLKWYKDWINVTNGESTNISNTYSSLSSLDTEEDN